MRFLNPGCICRWNIEQIIRKGFHFATAFAGKSNRDHFLLSGRFKCFYNISGITGSG